MCMYVLYSYFNSDANFLSCTALNHMVKEKLVSTKECHFIHIHEQDIGMLSLLLWYQIHALLNKLECICNDNISVAAFENQSYLYWISHRSLNVETITKNWLLWCKMNARRFWSWFFFKPIGIMIQLFSGRINLSLFGLWNATLLPRDSAREMVQFHKKNLEYRWSETHFFFDMQIKYATHFQHRIDYTVGDLFAFLIFSIQP